MRPSDGVLRSSSPLHAQCRFCFPRHCPCPLGAGRAQSGRPGGRTAPALAPCFHPERPVRAASHGQIASRFAVSGSGFPRTPFPTSQPHAHAHAYCPSPRWAHREVRAARFASLRAARGPRSLWTTGTTKMRGSPSPKIIEKGRKVFPIKSVGYMGGCGHSLCPHPRTQAVSGVCPKT